jgi:hypothetical protein
MRVLKSPEEIETRSAPDIAAEAHVEAMLFAR